MKKIWFPLLVSMFFAFGVAFAGPEVFRTGVKIMPPLQVSHNTEILSTDRAILITDKPIQFLDAGGASRNVTLPAEASSTNLKFTIVNTSDGPGEDLVIRDDTPTILITIEPEQGQSVSCDGTNWKVWFDIGLHYEGTLLVVSTDDDYVPIWDYSAGGMLRKVAASEFRNYVSGDNITTRCSTVPPTTKVAGQIWVDSDGDIGGDGILCFAPSTGVEKCGQDVPSQDTILEGDSSWEIIDAGTGRADCKIDGELKARINEDGLDVNGTVTAEGYNVEATASPRVRALCLEFPGIDKFAGSIDWLYDKGADGAEYSSMYLRTVENGSNTTQMHYDANETRWEIASGKGLAATGPIMGGVNISSKSAATYTVGTDDPFESYGTMFINSDNDAITFYLESGVDGMWACFENGQGVSAALTIDAAAGDYLVHKGVRTGTGASIASTGALGDGCCVYCVGGTDWYVKGPAGSWSMP